MISIPPWSDFLPALLPHCVCANDFNPTLVWFSHSLKLLELLIRENFNPTLVWFSLLNLWMQRFKIYLFQSHLGLIFSQRGRQRASGTTNFNPTLVWFSPTDKAFRDSGHRLISIPPWSDFLALGRSQRSFPALLFQSHLGLIFSIPDPFAKFFCENFNPTLVWFSPKSQYEPPNLFNKFQSHLGLIFSTNPSPSAFLCSDFNPTLVWFSRGVAHRR